MNKYIGTVHGISGVFFVKYPSGDVIQLRSGDRITEGMLVYGDQHNPTSAHINIKLNIDGKIFALEGAQEQLFNALTLNGIIDAAEDKDNTAAGSEEAKADDAAAQFAERDGAIVDVNSTLRDAKFIATSHTFILESFVQNESDRALSPISHGNLLSPASSQTPDRPAPIPSPVVPTSLPTTTPPTVVPSKPGLFGTVSMTGDTIVHESETASYKLSVTNAPLTNLVIAVQISNVTTQDTDIAPRTIYVTIPQGQTSVTFNITNLYSSQIEPNEIYSVKVIGTSGGGYTALTLPSEGIDTTIIDSVKPVNDSASVSEGDNTLTSTATTNLLANDEKGINGKITQFNYTDANGDPQTTVLTGGTATVTTQNGKITINDHGSWSYTSNTSVSNPQDAPLPDKITYTVVDGTTETGIRSGTGVFTLNITDSNPTPHLKTTTIDENNIKNLGSDGNTTTVDTVTQSLGITQGKDNIKDVQFTSATTDTLTTAALKSGGVALSYTITDGGHTLTATAGSNTVFTAVINNATTDTSGAAQSVTFTLDKPLDQVVGNSTNTLNIPLDYKISDIDSSITTDSTNRLNVTVVDDVPTARADTNNVTEDAADQAGHTDGSSATTIIAGNVITNTGYTTQSDTIGADFTTTPVSGVKAGSDTSIAATASVGSDVTGTYGKVNIASDGSYTYTLDNTNLAVQGITTGEHLTDTFTYTITDSDGDTSTTTLKVQIDGANDGVTVTVPNVTTGTLGDNSDQVVYESGLATHGSNPNVNDITVVSSFTLKALDGLKELVVGTTTLSATQVEALSTTNQTIDTGKGTLVLNGYSLSSDGTITVDYKYTLKDNVTHDKTTNDTSLNDSITIKANDTDTDTQTQTLNIKIVDDTPTARADTNNVTEDAADQAGHIDGSSATTIIAGNVITNTGDTTQSDTIGADFTTTPVSGVKAGSDTSIAATVNVGNDVTGTYGKVNIASDGTYTYTLDNTNLAVQKLLPTESVTDSFVYTIKDSDGDTSTTTLTITIKGTDDGVTVSAPEDYTKGTGVNTDQLVYESGLATGSSTNVANTHAISSFTIQALDGLSTTSDAVTLSGSGFSTTLTKAQIEALDSTHTQTVTTQYGTLLLNGYTQASDGTITIKYDYTLTSAPTVSATDTMDDILITAHDRGGVLTVGSDTLSIKIMDDTPQANADSRNINEGPNSITGNVVTGTTNGDSADRGNADGLITNPVVKLMYGSTEITLGTKTETTDGYITLNSDGSYTFEAKSGLNNPSGNDLVESFTYTIQDRDGDQSSAILKINVKDLDATISDSTEASISENTLPSGSLHNGLTSVDGTLTVTPATDAFDVQFNASAFPSGLKSGGVSLVYTISTDGHTLTATAGASGPTVFTTILSNTTTTTPQYTFTLSAPLDHAAPASGQDTNTLAVSSGVKVVEYEGSVATATLTVKVIDDVPTANADATVMSVSEGKNALIGMVNLLANDTKGADGATVTSFSFAGASHTVSGSTATEVVSSTDGTLSVKADGTWTYTSPQSVDNTSGDVTKSFTYTITDKDGDSSTATQKISVTDGADPAINPVSMTIREEDLGSGATLTPKVLSESLHVVQGADAIASTKFTTSVSDLTALGITSDGHALSYTVASDGSSIIATRAGDNAEVFRITLTDSGATGGYDFKLSLPIDHTISTGHDTDWIVPFSVTTTDTDGSSATGSFNVDIQDSTPTAANQTVTTNEDTSVIIRLSQDAFGNSGSITINNGDGNGNTTVAIHTSINILDPNNSSAIVGTLTNNGDGTVTFAPAANYSNYAANPSFDYTVSDTDGDTASANVILTITPVADAPTMQADRTVTAYEDSSWNGTSYTGDITKAIGLGLVLPTRNDQTDINAASTGDAPERIGVLTLSFTGSSDFATATIGYDTNGDGTLDGTLTTITKNSSFTIDITDVANYHPTGTSGTYHLTQAQYNSLAIIPAEDNATNIKMTVKTASHEVTDSGALLSTDIVSATQTQNVTLDVKAVTDPITLSFDNSTSGTLSAHPNSNDTYTANASIAEGIHVIDLQALLTNTSGTTVSSPNGDLDGSEIRSYTISGIPEGTIINLGGTTATATTSDGHGHFQATVNFSAASNKLADPTFTMTPPEHFSGQIDATITLSVHDTDSDSTVTPVTNTQTVYFHQMVTAVAGPVTLQVAQAKGNEDAGRSAGNTANDAGAAVIDQPANGIPLHINVTSADTDGSEKYTVEISAIPTGATLYYNNAEVIQSPAGTVSIADFNNSTPLTIVPPHNSDVDFTLQVKAHSVDNDGVNSFTGADSAALALNVQVIGVADVPVNNTLATVTVNDDTSVARTFNLVTTENHSVNIKDVLADAANLHSYDNDTSETLSIKVTGLAAGFDISGATFLGGSGTSRIWYVNVADLQTGAVTLSAPAHYAGEVDFTMSMITTEREGNSKTNPAQTISVMITPVVDASMNTHSTQNEDQIVTLDFGLSKPDGDTVATSGVEKLTSFAIDMSGVPSGVILTGSSSGVLSGSGYVTLHVDSNGVLETVTATLPANSNMNGGYSFGIKYSIADTTQDSNGHSYTAVKNATDTYTVTVNAVTDTDTSLSINATNVTGAITADSSHTVSVTNNGTFTQTLDLHAPSDIDGSESLTRIEVSGVPQGVSVVGGHYAGNIDGNTNTGVWYVDVNPDEAISSADTLHNLVFNVDGVPITGNYAITVTAFNQDTGASEHANTTTFNLDIANNATFTSTTIGTPATIDSFYQDINQDHTNDTATPSNTVYAASVIREDTQFTLGSVMDVNTTNSSDFAITLKNIPAGIQVNGMTYSPISGFYTIHGSGDSAAVTAALNSITITPATNSSTDANNISSTDLKFDVELTTYATGGAQNTSLVHFTGSVLPVTDHMDLTTVNDGTTTEDTAQTFSVKLDNAADGTNTVIVGGKAYVQLNEAYSDTQGVNGANGVLTVAGHTMTLQTLDIGNGSQSYYVISGVTNNETLNFSYQPASHRDGSVSVDVSVQNQEASNWSGYSTATLLSTQTVTFNVAPVQNGFTFDTTTTPSVGTEDLMTQLHVAVTNPDSSEKLLAVSLNNVPNNFLVYYGADAASAVLANNVGANGTTTVQMTYGVNALVTANLWNIPLTGGALPAYIGIVAPKNWSGTLSNLSYDVIDNSGETHSSAFDVTVNAVADGMSINPTIAFNNAYSWTNINLNASMVDLDGSESMTLQLSAKSGSTALDSTAIFRLVDGTAIDSSHAIFDSSTHTWTLSGIASGDINNLQMLYHDYTGTVQATAQTVEASNLSTSSTITGEFSLSLTATTSIDLHTETRDLNIVTTNSASTVLGGSGNDTIHTGIGNNVIDGGGGADTITAGAGNDTITTDGLDTIDGGAGLDTIKLVSGITLDFSKLHNIETIDLTANGAHTISNLKLSDVFNITDSNHILEIKGDGTDSVNAVDKTGWTKTSGVDNGTSTTYIYHDSSSNSITLKVDDNINHTAL